MAVLLGPEHVARPADLEVAQGDLEPTPERLMARDRREALVRLLRELALRREEEVRERALVAPPDAPAELVHLRQAEHLRGVHHERVRVRHVQARLDDHGRDEDVGLPVPEPHHPPLERLLVHLSVRHDDPRVGDLFLEPRRLPVDRRDPVVDPEHLSLAQELATHGADREPLVVLTDVGEHGLAVFRRGVDRRQVADARERHLERPRDRRGRHRQDVHLRPELLQALLVRDAEALLLVDDDAGRDP